jgi:hypothetical protein
MLFVCFICHVEISQTMVLPYSSKDIVGKALMRRGDALRWFGSV